jgi:hypothetical protein
LYYKKKRDFEIDLFTCYKEEIREKHNTWVRSRLTTDDPKFLVGTMVGDEVFQRDFNKYLSNNEIDVKPDNSIFYIGKKKESFSRFYQDVSKNLFERIANDLPSRTVLRNMGLKGLHKNTTLSERPKRSKKR